VSHSIGGPGNNVYVTLIERADNERSRATDLPRPTRRAQPSAALNAAPSALHGKRAHVEAATTIHVTASSKDPIHVALLSVDGRRVFAKLDDPLEPGADATTALRGRSARFLVKDDGDHYFQLIRDRWTLPLLLRSLMDRLRP
jgi:hypothetical protein